MIPLLALLPLLAPDEAGRGRAAGCSRRKGVAAIAVVVVGSRLVMRPALKLIARYGGREVFTAAALLVVIGAALIMEAIGLSMSLGAFLAGVLLADSEFRHELEADIEPFKGLLLGLFFMAVGMSANLALLRAQPLAVLGARARPDAVKGVLVYAIARADGIGNDDAQRIAVLLAQGGEFAFVLFTAAQAAGILGGATAQLPGAGGDDLDAARAAALRRCTSACSSAGSSATATPEFDVDRRARQPGDHRRLRPLRPDRVARAAHGRHSRSPRSRRTTSRSISCAVRQQGVLRRRLAPRAAAKRRRRATPSCSCSRSTTSRLRVKTAALVRKHFPNLPILARARNRVHYSGCATSTFRGDRARDVPVEPRDGAPGADRARPRRSAGGARRRSCSSEHDEALLEQQYAVRQDEAQFIQTAAQAAAQLQELFEADANETKKSTRVPLNR